MGLTPEQQERIADRERQEREATAAIDSADALERIAVAGERIAAACERIARELEDQNSDAKAKAELDENSQPDDLVFAALSEGARVLAENAESEHDRTFGRALRTLLTEHFHHTDRAV